MFIIMVVLRNKRQNISTNIKFISIFIVVDFMEPKYCKASNRIKGLKTSGSRFFSIFRTFDHNNIYCKVSQCFAFGVLVLTAAV